MTMYRLLIGETHLDIEHRCLIGRSDDCDVALSHDHSVSRWHAMLTVCANGVVVEDLGSTNGVWLDGQRLSVAQLVVGAHVLRVGESDLRLVPEATVRQPLGRRTAAEDPTARGLPPVVTHP
jgi:pSer/pThr/pTyr-binding forkhead associated (FHA) protein